MQEKLESLRLDKFLEINSWAGLSPTPGSQGIIITKDKKIYYYHKYHRIPDSLKDKIKLEEISEGRLIDEDIYLGNLNNNSFNINNHFNIYNDLKRIIYSKEKAE